jgi:hypothetical protein
MILHRYPTWAASAISLLFLLSSCGRDTDVAGGSSGVENPEIVLSFSDRTGASAAFTGSLRIYPADRNPAIDPEAVSQIRLDGDTVIRLTHSDFSRSGTGAATAFNILLTGDDSLGAMLSGLVYHPTERKFSGPGSPDLSRAKVPLVGLVRHRASLDRASSNHLERVFIPGSPFQAVVEDSQFTFEKVPQGVYPVRMIRNHVEEIRLPDSLNTATPARLRVDTAAPVIPRQQPSPPALKVDAGEDHIVSLNAETLLSGSVSGANPVDPRLALAWRQVSPDPATARAVLAFPNQPITRVTLPQTGVYRFVLIASFGMNPPVADTVFLDAKGTAFLKPVQGDTLAQDASFIVVWSDTQTRTLTLQYTVNGGGLWGNIATNLASQAGLNSHAWTPTKSPYNNCYMRLLGPGQVEVARSGRFTLRAP